MNIGELKAQADPNDAEKTEVLGPDVPLEGDRESESLAFGHQDDAEAAVQQQDSDAEAQAADDDAEAAEEASRKRRYERATVLWGGKLLHGEHAVDCLIVNISAGGAMIQVQEKVEEGASVILKNSRLGAFAGKVVWCKDNQFGMSFYDEPEEIAEALGGALA